MATFNSERLKSARLLAGLSLRQLEDKLSGHISYSTINKYEKGQMQPEPATVIRLAECLRVRPSYFFEKNTIDIGKIDFRKKTSLTQTETAHIIELTRDKVQRYLETESLFCFTIEFDNPIATKQVREVAKADEMADRVRAEWGLGSNPIPNVIEMLERNEVKVIEVQASEKFDGLSTYVAHGVPVVVVNEIFAVERKRFTALHELGHLMMNLKLGTEKEKEAACHRFAGAMLFPEAEVKKTLGDKRSHIAWGELAAIKEEYGISAQAIMRRALDLGVITPGNYKQICMKLSDKEKEQGLGIYPGEEKSHRLLKMIFRLLSEGAIDESRAASLAGLPTNVFLSMYHYVPIEDIKAPYDMANAAFADAWGEEEPEYSLNDVKSINPDYEGW